SIDDLQLLDDRAGPAVVDDQRQRVFMLRANVNEVDVQPVDLGDELRQGVQCRLASAPVVPGRPVAREFLNHCERHALRLIRDGLLPGARSGPRRGGGGGPGRLRARGSRRGGWWFRSWSACPPSGFPPPPAGRGEARMAVPAGLALPRPARR